MTQRKRSAIRIVPLIGSASRGARFPRSHRYAKGRAQEWDIRVEQRDGTFRYFGVWPTESAARRWLKTNRAELIARNPNIRK